MKKGGLDKTFETLAKTNNEAATTLLLQMLQSADRGVQTDALRALVRRRSPSGHRELLRRWHTIGERFKATVAEQSHRISGAVRDAILSGEEQLSENGLDAVLRLADFDLLPALLTAGEDQTNPRRGKAARAVLTLCEMLYEEIASGPVKKGRRDPKRTRQFLMPALEKSAGRYDQHKNNDILEAFLLLASQNNPTLRRLLQNPHAKAYLPTVNLLSQSTRPGIQKLLVSFLEDVHPPTTISSILSKRRDVQFLRYFFRSFQQPVEKPMLRNVKRIESFSWLDDELNVLKALSEEEQRGVVDLVTAAGINRLDAFKVIKFMLVQGSVEARRAASNALAEFHGAESNQLVLQCLDDSDSEVKAHLVRQLRDRGIPNAMQRLLELVVSSDPLVSEAARDSLSEFSFERFLASYELLNEEVALNTGRLVLRIDRDAVKKLSAEFETRSRTRRIRALGIAVAMDAVRDVEEYVVAMLKDEDHFIRAEAARALKSCETEAARHGLRDLLLDRSPSVQEAAEQTLQSFAKGVESIGPLPSIEDVSAAWPPGQELTR